MKLLMTSPALSHPFFICLSTLKGVRGANEGEGDLNAVGLEIHMWLFASLRLSYLYEK